MSANSLPRRFRLKSVSADTVLDPTRKWQRTASADTDFRLNLRLQTQTSGETCVCIQNCIAPPKTSKITTIHNPCMPHYRTMACSKQLKNMLEAAQPPAPAVHEFMKFVHKVAAGNANDVPAENEIFGNIINENAGKAPGSAKNEVNGCNLCIEYDAMLQRNQVGATLDFDSWMCGLVQFTINVEVVSDQKETQEALLQKRKDLCGNQKTGRSLSCGSFRTYMNALQSTSPSRVPPLIHWLISQLALPQQTRTSA